VRVPRRELAANVEGTYSKGRRDGDREEGRKMSDPEWKFEQDSLALVVSRSAGNASIAWEGVSDSPDPSAFLDAVIRRAVRELKGCAVAVDFRKLEYMNSATVSPLINLVKALDVGSLGCWCCFRTPIGSGRISSA
jgi:hypothetical protein